jgi:hypothetical protein
MTAARWQLERQTARLQAASVAASIDLSHPDRGIALRVDSVDSVPTLSVLGFALGDAADFKQAQLDAYVRQSDLIATFERADPRPMRAQLYWQWIDPAQFAPDCASKVLAAVDLVASVNTSLLDADPASMMRTSIEEVAAIVELARSPGGLGAGLLFAGRPACGVSIVRGKANTGCFVARCASDLSWVEMVHPSDFCGSTINIAVGSPSEAATSQVGFSHKLFEQRLEKGVILRARVRGALVQQSCDVDVALAAYERFSASEPPLTV